ncbi:MAG: KilA-N domain-containing protein [Bacteroidales bacterium]|nr:KilA-N domain-containing protein [Bacteroidales bacterium]
MVKIPFNHLVYNSLIEAGKSLNGGNLIVTKKGGYAGIGFTWMHEDVAKEFARWLSPATYPYAI